VAGSTVTAAPAGATGVTVGGGDGDALQIGGSNANSNPGNTTGLSGSLTSAGPMLEVHVLGTSSGRIAVRGAADTEGSPSVGVVGETQSEFGPIFPAKGAGVHGVAGGHSEDDRAVPSNAVGAVGELRTQNTTTGANLWLPDTGQTMPPSASSWDAGDLVMSGSALWLCTTGGTGTASSWANLSTGERLVTLRTPARVYDSRIGQQPLTGPKAQITDGSTVSVDVTGPKAGGGTSGVPSGATAVLGNLTLINGPNTVFLTVFATGTMPPATSNINALGGQVIANNFTSQIGTSNQISIKCGFGPTDFIIDIFGYYP
jgi:hypothetical protein